MKVNFECNNNYNRCSGSKPQSFGAKMPIEDVILLITSVKKDCAESIGDFYESAARRLVNRARLPYQDNMVCKDNILSDAFANLYTLLEQVKSFPSNVVKLVRDNKNVFNIVNADNKEILGSGNTPMVALDNAYVMRSRYELAPKFWGHKIPLRVFVENKAGNKDITEQVIIDFAQNM